jgi:two-component system cell cycle sensor histidine kinase/response regulator CckA
MLSSVNVLVVDDDPAVRAYAADVLRGGGHTVIEAGNGAEALAANGSLAEPLGLLVTDIDMPGMDGRTLAGILAARRPGLKVIYISGRGLGVTDRGGRLEDWESFLGKPFGPSQLHQMVRDLMDEAERSR